MKNYLLQIYRKWCDADSNMIIFNPIGVRQSCKSGINKKRNTVFELIKVSLDFPGLYASPGHETNFLNRLGICFSSKSLYIIENVENHEKWCLKK